MNAFYACAQFDLRVEAASLEVRERGVGRGADHPQNPVDVIKFTVDGSRNANTVLGRATPRRDWCSENVATLSIWDIIVVLWRAHA
jgi:hypothetical protein